MPKKPETILAVDPGLREIGYAVLSGRRYLAGGVLDLRKCPKDRRLPTARRHLGRWVRTHRPRVIVLEKTYRHPVPWLNALHLVALTARRIARRRRLRFACYAPQRVRQSVLGNGKAKKIEVAHFVASLYPQLRIHLTQDRKWKEKHYRNLFDAVALALHHQRAAKPPSRGR